MKKLLIAPLLLFLLVYCCAIPAADSPQDLVRETSDRMIEALRNNRDQLQKNPAQIYDLVNDIVLPHFDFTVMSRWVLGKYWRQATPDQRERFTDEFRTLMVRTYSQALLEYSNEEIVFPPSPPWRQTPPKPRCVVNFTRKAVSPFRSTTACIA